MTARRISGVSRVFVDTAAFFAILDASDNNHRAAQSIMLRLASQSAQLTTSNFILVETHALTLSRIGRSTALRFIEEIDRSSTAVIRVSPADEQRARAIIRQYNDKNFSLTDGTSFSIMDRLKIVQVFTFDSNFAQYGLAVLQP